MKYKDHVYDEDLKKATIWLENITFDELTDLILEIKDQSEDNKASNSKTKVNRFEDIIFGG